MSAFLHRENQQPDFPVDIWFGQIARAVGDFTERAYVILPDFAQDKQLGPCFWQARDSVTLPARGDRCVVVFDNRGQIWVLAWWPFST